MIPDPVWFGLGGEPLSWLALAGLAAILSIDDTAFAQTWLSLPLPAGLLTGLVLGEPVTGLIVGTLAQLATLGNLPVGRSYPAEPVAATVGVAGGAILAGARIAAPWRGDGALLAGWLLAAICLASLAGRFAVQAERRAHWRWVRLSARTLVDGDLGRISRIGGFCVAVTGLRGAVLGLLWAGAVQAVWLPSLTLLPVGVGAGVRLLPLVAIWLAVGTVIERFGPRHAAPRVVGWAVAGFLALRYFG